MKRPIAWRLVAVANLALFFSTHTLFADVRLRHGGPVRIAVPEWSTFSPRAAAVTILAFFMAFKLKWKVPRLLGACAVIGGAIYFAAR